MSRQPTAEALKYGLKRARIEGIPGDARQFAAGYAYAAMETAARSQAEIEEMAAELLDERSAHQQTLAEVQRLHGVEARIKALLDRATGAAGGEFEDPTPIPGWTTLVERALDGEA